jgi:type III secretory pathway component EscS
MSERGLKFEVEKLCAVSITIFQAYSWLKDAWLKLQTKGFPSGNLNLRQKSYSM